LFFVPSPLFFRYTTKNMKLSIAILLGLLPWVLSAQSPFDSLELVRSESVYFDFGKYDLRPEAVATLSRLSNAFNDKTGWRLYITAHTDSIGTPANNQRLSLNRGNAVKDFLAAQGWPAERMLVQVFGEERPVAANETDDGRQLNRRATIDVYQELPITRISGAVTDQETGKGLPADIIIHTKDWRDSIRTDSSGRFAYSVPENTVVGVDVYVNGYFFETQMLKARKEEMKAPLDIKLKPLRKGEAIDIKNLYFVGNQAILLPPSEPELPKVLKFMEINPTTRIEIAGHINRPNSPKVTTDSWDYGLSVRRAKLVYDYLIENGIDPDRIVYKGYGNWEMRYPFARSEKEQELNRRVEIRIIE
jgi:outer membrane protein OmpA-like peptidoglycan-associated protein